MINKNLHLDRKWLAGGSIAAAVVLFLGVNIWANLSIKNARMDLTEERVFTVSEGTKDVLRSIDEPIRLRLFLSEAIRELGPGLTTHAKRIDEMLQHYAEIADGKLTVERYDPKPFSTEEDLALSDGLKGFPFDSDGGQIYMGLSGANSTGDTKVVPYLAPERANFLEYDLTRLVHDLANPDKPKVAVLGDLPLSGNQMTGYRPWAVMEQLREFFEVRSLFGSVEEIEDDVKVLILAQPGELDEKTLYAIDQFALRGGRILAFVDPHAEVLAAPQPGLIGGKAGAIDALEPLLASWGVEIAPDELVGDRDAAVRVQARHNGRDVVTDYLAWLSLGRSHLAQDDLVTGNLEVIHLKSAGHITRRDDASTSLEPLISTSANAGPIDVAAVNELPDPVGLLADFEPAGEPYVVAARVTGPIVSAFPDGPPESITEDTAAKSHLKESREPLNLLLVADADIIADGTWLQRQSLLGQSIIVPLANNGDFAVNAVDNLAGAQGLVDLRGKGLKKRPFTAIAQLRQKAEDEFRETEKALLTRIDETKAKIRELQEEDQDGAIVLTAAQQTTIEDFRREMLGLRKELRDVQYALREEVDGLIFWLRALNLWTVPILVGLAALALAAVRRHRARQSQIHPVH